MFEEGRRTKEIEHFLRRTYGQKTKAELIDHCIELQRKIEILEFHAAAIDATNSLHDVAIEIQKQVQEGKSQ